MKSVSLVNIQKETKSKLPLKATVSEISGDPAIVSRLHEMGLKNGLSISIEGRAPFGGAFLIRFGTTAIALRSEEAACTLIHLS